MWVSMSHMSTTRQSEACGSSRHWVISSYEHISGMVMAGHMSIEAIRAFILKALMPLVFIRTFPSSYDIIYGRL